uniref:HORMA domain containing protein n=2 Tax=Babesia bovis TaxID=5865 RepID=A7ATB1_BABBO|eukprot:XP_001609740.1 HORMA domain containing protein [Babesia bovis T2Bo]
MSKINSQESANVLRNFVKVGISSIAYLRNLFAECAFEDTVVGGLQLKRLTRAVPESAALLDWIDEGVFDAMGKEYLKELVVTIHNSEHVPLESYTFALQYAGNTGECSVQLSVGHFDGSTDNAKQRNGRDNPISTPVTEPVVINNDKEEVKRQTINVLRDLVLLAQSLSPLPDNRYLSMMLFYYEDRVPKDYDPPHFRTASDADFRGIEISNLEQQVGELETGHHNLAVDVRSCCYLDDNVTTYKTNGKSLDTLTRRQSISCNEYAPRAAREYSAGHRAVTNSPYGTGMHSKDNTRVAQPRSTVTNRNNILDLLKRSHIIATKTKYVNKECLIRELGIDDNLAKAIFKK